MNAKLAEISERRARLTAQADVQREALAHFYRQFDKPARTAQTALTLGAILKSPIVLTGLTTLLVRSRWRNIGRLPKLLWKGWTIVAALNRIRK